MDDIVSKLENSLHCCSWAEHRELCGELWNRRLILMIFNGSLDFSLYGLVNHSAGHEANNIIVRNYLPRPGEPTEIDLLRDFGDTQFTIRKSKYPEFVRKGKFHNLHENCSQCKCEWYLFDIIGIWPGCKDADYYDNLQVLWNLLPDREE